MQSTASNLVTNSPLRRKKPPSVLSAIPDPRVRDLLGRLHAAADRQAPGLYLRFVSQVPRLLLGRNLAWDRIESRLDDQFIAVDPEQGVFLYLLARSMKARRIVEFGTSFGVSTLYLALAVRDNGGGVVISAERVEAKAERARAHLAEAGLESFVDLRVGDALTTLADLEGPIDLMLNDGFPAYALPVLKLVEPAMREGTIVVTDNVGAFRADYADYVRYLRDPAHGWMSTSLNLNEGTEFSVRTPAAAGSATMAA